jgi:hypothetical protein
MAGRRQRRGDRRADETPVPGHKNPHIAAANQPALAPASRFSRSADSTPRAEPAGPPRRTTDDMTYLTRHGDGSRQTFDRQTVDVVRLFNSSFTGDPLTPADAMALSTTVDFSDFTPTPDGRLHLDSSFSYEFAAYLKGEATVRDVDLLSDLPELALTQVNNHWLVRMGERIMRIGSELGEGRVPRPQCLADEYALWLVIQNTDPPQIGDVLDTFPGLRDAEDVFGYDPDVDDLDDEAAIREEWMNRMVGGLLPPHDSRNHRRYDLEIMEACGQGIYDPTDPRHPLRWFDRDDLRERCESELAFVRLPKEEQDARTAEELKRMSELMSPGTINESR